MNKIQILKWGLIAMVILNLGLMAFVWQRTQREAGAQGPQPDITRIFDFDADQLRRFEESKRAHHDKLVELQRALTDKSVAYYQTALKAPAGADSLMAEINTISTRIYQNHLSHFTDISEICTPDQRKNLDGFIARLIRRPPPPPGGRRPFRDKN